MMIKKAKVITAFAYEGGGPKGAYQAGATKALAEAGIKPQVLTGISVGAINAAYYAQNLDIKGLEDVWCASNEDVFKGWFWGYLQGFFKGGLKSSEPLKKRLEAELDLNKIKSSGVKLRLGAVSLTTGEYKLWTESDEDIIDGVLASAAHPVFLPYVKARGELWTDGGVRHVTPLKSAIKAGAQEVWVLRSGDGNLSRWDKDKPNVLDRAIRELEILLHEAHQEDFKVTELINAAVRSNTPEVSNKREVKVHQIIPSKALKVDFFNFSEQEMKELFDQGYADALDYLSKLCLSEL